MSKKKQIANLEKDVEFLSGRIVPILQERIRDEGEVNNRRYNNINSQIELILRHLKIEIYEEQGKPAELKIKKAKKVK